MTDKEIEDIIKSNMNLQMNFAGIRQDFEEKLQRTWVGLTDEEKADLFASTAPYYNEVDYADAIEAKLKEKNI